MPTTTGTYDIGSLLAASNQSAAAFGEDRIAEILDADMRAHNRVVREEFLNDLVEVTPDRQRVSGLSTTGTMLEVSEYGRAPTQKQVAPPSLGFPLKLYQFNIGWTRKYLQQATPADLAIAQISAQRAHLSTLMREAKKAFFLSTNYTWTDRLIDNVSLSVKRLANADSFAIPNGPNNQSFTSSTHTHYTAEASLTAAGLLASVNTVLEHRTEGVIEVSISSTDETAVSALTGFTAATDPRLILASTTTTTRDALNIRNAGDRLIGYFRSAEVWVRPWAIANYAVVWRKGYGTRPLAMRVRDGNGGGLVRAAEIDLYPLRAEYNEAEFGFGVLDRVGMAVHYFGGGSYTDPTIVS